jgi:hypothetical protein
MRTREVVLLAAAVAAGAAIGFVDSRPSWDDTGITVFALLIAGAVSAALGGRRPWVFALLVGGFVPLLEIPRVGGSGPLFALLFSSVGAGIGYVLGSTFDGSR